MVPQGGLRDCTMKTMDYLETIGYLRYSYDWLPLLRQYKKFEKVVELADDAYLSDFPFLSVVPITHENRQFTERQFIIRLIKGDKVFSEISFKSAYNRDVIQDFKKQIKDLHKESNGRFVGGLPYVSFSANPTYFWRLMNHDSCNEKPIYHKFDVDEYNELFNTYYITVAEAVENNPNVLFYEEEIDSSFID